MAVWLTARYLMALRKLAEKNNDAEPDLKVLREFCHDVVALRRGDHSAARLKIEQERLERNREETEAVDHFKRWANNPKVREAMGDWNSLYSQRFQGILSFLNFSESGQFYG